MKPQNAPKNNMCVRRISKETSQIHGPANQSLCVKMRQYFNTKNVKRVEALCFLC